MNSVSTSRLRLTRRKSAFLACLGAIALAALVLFPAVPAAHARLDDTTPALDAATGANTEIVITGVAEGLRATGYLPPTAIVPDPEAPYPDSAPADYTSRSGFIGIITTASVDDPSSTGEMYCIAARTPTAVGIGYQSGTWSESNVPNIGYVTYILNNYFPAVAAPAELDPNEQAAATQAAIWYFTDGLVLGSEPTEVRAGTAAIIAAAQANGPVAEPAAPELTINPAAASAPEGTAAGPYVVTATGAAAVTVSVPTGYTMYSDATATTPIADGSSIPSGTAIWITGPGVTGVETVLTARGTVTVQRGNIYLYDGNTGSYSEAQPLVLADTSQLDAVVTATTEFFVAGELTVTKTFAGDGVGEQGASQLVIDCGGGFTFTADIAAGTTDAQTFTYGGIRVGSTCTVTEPTTGASAAVTVTSDAPQSVVLAEEGSEVTVTNTVTSVATSAPSAALAASGGATPLSLLPAGGVALILGSILIAAAYRSRRSEASHK